jgi:hypothetical protein
MILEGALRERERERERETGKEVKTTFKRIRRPPIEGF